MAVLNIFLQIGSWHLNRLQRKDAERRTLFVLIIIIFEVDDAPDAAAQQLLVLLYISVIYDYLVNVDIEDSALVVVRFLVEFGRYLVDYLVMSAFTDLGFNLFRFIRTHKVVCQYMLYGLNTFFYIIFIVCGAVHAEQIFQNITRNIRTLFYSFGKVFADNFTTITIIEFLI